MSWLGFCALLGTLFCVLSPALMGTSLHERANEAAAIGALKAIGNAQTLYREGDKNGNSTLDYAPNLERLTNTGFTRQEDLIDEVLASGTKQGYVFAITSSSEFGWTATANPRVPGTTGDRYFGTNMEGEIFYNDERPVRFAADGSSEDEVLGR